MMHLLLCLPFVFLLKATEVFATCPAELTDDAQYGENIWNETRSYNTALSPCFYGPPGKYARRFCHGEVWNDTDYQSESCNTQKWLTGSQQTETEINASRMRCHPESETVKLVSTVATAISMTGLALTLISYLAFKSIRETFTAKLHVQLSIAIFSMLLVFVVGIAKTESTMACIIVSAFIHYFTLVAVLWTGCEAVILFTKVTFVFLMTKTRHFVIFLLLCWGLPLVFVGIPLAINPPDLILLSSNDTDDSNNSCSQHELCFIGQLDTSVIFFLVPITVVVLWNFIVLIRVVFVVKQNRYSHSDASDKVRRMFSIIGVTTLILGPGLAWVISFLSFKIVFQYIFELLLSVQGLFIFIFFCLLRSDIRKEWAGICQRKKRASQKSHSQNASDQIKENGNTVGKAEARHQDSDRNSEV